MLLPLQLLLLQVVLIPLSLGSHQITRLLQLNTWSQSYHHHASGPPGGTDTVIIREPPNPTVTTTEYWSQSYATTLTITAPPGGTNSVIIRVHSSTNDESSESTFSTLSVPCSQVQ